MTPDEIRAESVLLAEEIERGHRVNDPVQAIASLIRVLGTASAEICERLEREPEERVEVTGQPVKLELQAIDSAPSRVVGVEDAISRIAEALGIDRTRHDGDGLVREIGARVADLLRATKLAASFLRSGDIGGDEGARLLAKLEGALAGVPDLEPTRTPPAIDYAALAHHAGQWVVVQPPLVPGAVQKVLGVGETPSNAIRWMEIDHPEGLAEWPAGALVGRVPSAPSLDLDPLGFF